MLYHVDNWRDFGMAIPIKACKAENDPQGGSSTITVNCPISELMY